MVFQNYSPHIHDIYVKVFTIIDARLGFFQHRLHLFFMKSLQRDSFSMKHIKVQYVYVGLLAYFLFDLVNMTQQSKRQKFGLSQILLGML